MSRSSADRSSTSRWRPAGARLSRLALGLVLIATLGIAEARSHHGQVDHTAGEFDFYLLSLSWSPAYCLDSPMSSQCNGSRAYGFVVHGLWPQNERGWPERCATSRVPESVATGMLDLMPSRGLVYHEWSTHGTCSGLTPEDYFRLVRTARATIRIPDEFGRPGAAVERAPQSVQESFLRANPRLAPDSLLVSCSGGNVPRLKEVRVCLDRDLRSRACSADARRAACRAPTLIVPPVR